LENWRLRKATISDFGFIFRVYRTTMKEYIEQIWEWDDGAQRQHYEQSFSADDYKIIQLDNDDIGVVSMLPMDEYDFLARIEIMPDYQNQGIGTAIMQSLIEHAKETKHPIMLRVFKINPAQNLYKRLGFQTMRQDDIHYDMFYATVDE